MRSATASLPRCPVCGFEQPGDLPKTPEAGTFFCCRPSCGLELFPGEPGELRVRTLRLANHYSLCVLPFSFADADERDVCRRLAESGRWRQRTFSPDDPEDVDRTEYFLPYIRRFLFPSLFAGEPGADGRARGEPTCRHFRFDLALLGKAGPGGVPLALRCRDVRKNLPFRYDLVLEQAELIVFSYRVGFLVLRFRCADEGASYFDQMNTLTFLRAFAPLYRGFELPELAAGEARFRVPQLLAWLLEEFGRGHGAASPASLAERPALPVKPIYDDRMMVYSFSCLDRDTCQPGEEKCRELLHRAAVVNFEPDATGRAPARQKEEDVADWLRTRWEGFSKDGGSLVVFNTDRFHERFMGVYHGTYYFDVFLLAALQRMTLLTLFERLSAIEDLTTGGARGRRHLRRVRFDLLLFKNQCWFSQITNRERGLVLWRKWQEVFENRTLLTEVNEQSEELDNYLRSRTQERVEWLVRLGGFLAAAVPAVLGLNVLFGDHEWVDTLKWVLLVSLIAGTGLFAWFVLIRQRDQV